MENEKIQRTGSNLRKPEVGSATHTRSVSESPIVPAARKARTVEAPTMRAGLWSDGSLHIERSGRVETFTPSETQYLMRFLDGMLLRTRDVTVS